MRSTWPFVDNRDRPRRPRRRKASLLGASPERLEPRAMLSAGPVIISEFLASNDDGLRDRDGDASDWIELHNPTGAAVDLAGWSLTDDADEPDKWAFPSVAIPPG